MDGRQGGFSARGKKRPPVQLPLILRHVVTAPHAIPSPPAHQCVFGHRVRASDVPAAADDTATTELTIDGVIGEHLDVTSRSANGWVSDPALWNIDYDTTPTVASDVYPGNGSGGGAGVRGHLHVHAEGEGRRELPGFIRSAPAFTPGV
ncbi:hypothetical protein ACFXDH_13250 [Streptomyces sp. NPDC059467]|uniref:hypothetical protein n=1 Tax=Streptomyces sp. NPDC059467 TaxID=3346844 RepID=UPI0036C4859E